MQDMMAAFEADVTEALIPFVDKTFRTIPDRDHRAMAGLSMGGMQTFHITLNHLDLFSHIGGFSGAAGPFITRPRPRPQDRLQRRARRSRPRSRRRCTVLWLGVGTAEPEGMRAGIRKLHASLTDAGHRARLPGVARHRSRVADLAAQSRRLRGEAVPLREGLVRTSSTVAAACLLGALITCGVGRVAAQSHTRVQPPASPGEQAPPADPGQISMSDPFVYPDEKTHTYYLIGSGGRLLQEPRPEDVDRALLRQPAHIERVEREQIAGPRGTDVSSHATSDALGEHAAEPSTGGLRNLSGPSHPPARIIREHMPLQPGTRLGSLRTCRPHRCRGHGRGVSRARHTAGPRGRHQGLTR